jgi:uncharacterized protein
MDSKHYFNNGKSGSAITVRISPHSKRNEISGILSDGTIKIRLAAPAEEGKANAALIKYLAQLFKIPVSNIEIVGGRNSRTKLVTITDLDSDSVQERIITESK